MRELAEIEFLDIEEDKKYKEIINKVYEMCFQEEKLDKTKLYIEITLTTPEQIQKINKKFRNIDKATDVLSFPMFEKDEIESAKLAKEPLGDIVICLPIVKKQAVEYGHSEDREFAYMLVHGFYHLMGYDHIEDKDKVKMRKKEENILNKLGLKLDA